ncbi:unnamed protein product [Caenorhabditis auriculariae]|uniref:chitin synthase n=1 Tax=Caenorhabditis auriculariae TaxID=2777116 RepID=A0A8S1HQ79_9PELO|nr:unnamed protein product [Caenorhabditis auriculariae]
MVDQMDTLDHRRMDTLDGRQRKNSGDEEPPPPPPNHNSYYFNSAAALEDSEERRRIKTQDVAKNQKLLPRDNEANSSTVIENKGWDIFFGYCLQNPTKSATVLFICLLIFRSRNALAGGQKPLENPGFWHDASLQVLKLATFIVLFALTLSSAVVAKSAFLLMTSAIGWGDQTMTICNQVVSEATQNTVKIKNQHVVKWVWATLLALCAPEALCFVRSLHRTMFKNVKRPTFMQFMVVLLIESLHSIGVGILVFRIFPDLDAVTAAQLTNAMCFVPSVLSLISRRPNKIALILVIIDMAAIAAQSSGFWAYPMFMPNLQKHSVAIPVSLTLVSLAWWQNFVHLDSVFPPVRSLARFASRLSERRSKTYAFVSLWKMCIYFVCAVLFISHRMKMEDLLQKDPFGEKLLAVVGHNMNQTQIDKFQTRINAMIEMANREAGYYQPPPKKPPKKQNPDDAEVVDTGEYKRLKRAVHEEVEEEEEEFMSYNIYSNYVERNQLTMAYDALWIVIVQVAAVFVCYHSSKFACKVMMQRMGFALPMALSVPCTVFVLSTTCHFRAKNPCHLTSFLTIELFWQCGSAYKSIADFVLTPQTWIWLCWLASQFWITIHLWNPKHERLAKSEKLFILPYYIGAFVDQSLAFNRRRDDKAKIKAEDLEFDQEDSSLTYETIPGLQGKAPPSVCSASSSKLENGLIRDSASSADAITKIYACATMWHETPHEMTCMLKSIFRLDEDQCARRNAQKYLKVIDPDYYEFEAHIFVDDAFDVNEYGEPQINKFVRQIVEVMDQAASAVHQTHMRLKPPKKAKTPYGGKLCYIMPGKNKLTIHLKDKNKIRNRKRWSQVMYLYYLLGYRLMMKVDDPARKEVISENTFILTLDGDVDFTPSCVHLLVDLMKKNRRLGAACGRIHPRGSGLMVWYQKFEYAIGHWLQKATEHMIGCVMCSPGCFSLFRSYALMDDNVTRKYASKSNEPLDYIQYDQGEDRWLCTLLLQRGYRVEYCAASDALTFAPEGFNEFFNQRRRWIPSTIANIYDLLKDYKNVVSVNESISIWYIVYQLVMLISSILGPGTIFLMVVGAISISFGIDTVWSLLIVTIPVTFFCIVCLTAKQDKQLVVAMVIGNLFAMLMTAVIVGTSLQIQKDGILSPHSIFLFAVITSFMTAAMLHPLEFTCIIPGAIYFLAIPCMYMLLPIYSLCNLNTVTWGTREDPRADEKNDLAKKQKDRIDGIEAGGITKDDGFADGCSRLLCCLPNNRVDPMTVVINEKLNDITKKLERLERKQQPVLGRRASILSSTGGTVQADKCSEADEDEQAELEDALEMSNQSHAAKKNQKWKQTQSEAWLSDKYLQRAEREFIEPEEENFWNDVIDKYLFPLSMDSKEMERIRAGLLELRNRVTAGFFMLNIVFIIVVLVLQLQKDCLHIEWPLGPKFNHTVRLCNGDSKEEVWKMTRLQLEPIGLVFLLFFMSILVIQFLAMLCHRFGTLAHIIASTELFCFRKTIDKLSEDELVVQNAVEIARELQAIRGVDEHNQETEPGEDRGISRRRVVQNLESSRRSMMKRKTETLDAAFKKRFFALSSEGQLEPGFSSRDNTKRLTLRKGTIRALEHRRDSLFGTLDNRKGQDDVDGAGASVRGPAQRRLERLFTAQQEQSPGEGRRRSGNPSWDKPGDVELRRF